MGGLHYPATCCNAAIFSSKCLLLLTIKVAEQKYMDTKTNWLINTTRFQPSQYIPFYN